MNFEQKLDRIIQEIKDIEHYTIDIKNAGKMERIEKDMLMEKIRHLYDELVHLDRHDSHESTARSKEITFEFPNDDQPVSKDPGKAESIKDKPVKEKKPQQKPAAPDKEKRQAAEKEKTAQHQGSSNKANRITYEDQSVEESQTVQKPAQEKGNSPEILADKYFNTQTSMHDSLASKQDHNNLSTKMQTKPIRDLSKAIGLNDRFLFIKELFEGNKEAYYEAVQIINEMPSLEEAENYIRERFHWDEDKPEVIKFMDLVRRRFIHG
jgi:hypothetical protein